MRSCRCPRPSGEALDYPLHSSFLSLTKTPAAANDLATIQQAITRCRRQTLARVAGIQPEIFRTQSHQDFSPVGWHLGHIAYTESLWIAEKIGGLSCLFPQCKSQYERLFAADGLPKAERQNLPVLAEVLDYLGAVREITSDVLKKSDRQQDAQLWHWLVQHESQHAETISMVLAMHSRPEKKQPAPTMPLSSRVAATDMVLVEAGEFYQGCDDLTAIDNERSVHPVYLGRYWIDQLPVTCDQYRQFIEAGGYQTQKWWSPQGWQWQQVAQLHSPLYWTDDASFERHPVCGVSWYEADAYARFVGKRLPTEAEWAKAAGWNAKTASMQRYPWGDRFDEEDVDALDSLGDCNYGHQVGTTTPTDAYPQAASPYGCLDMLGNVWEWTDSWFERYPGFRAFPYEGYSQVYFDGAHRVLRGGSWATPRWTLRNSFRNWYHPHKREMFAGFRCAV